MSRFCSSLTLIGISVSLNDSGVPVETLCEREVFANKFDLGLNSWVAARSAGLKADAEFQVRSCDYEGQQRARHNGIEYEVENVSDSGEFTRLTLKRRVSNG